MKIIGKILFFAFFSISSSIDISVTNLDGVDVNEVCINSPFLLKVSFKDLDHTPKFNIPGLDDDKIVYRSRGVSNFISNVNGSVTNTKVYSYIVEVNREGEYNFGPLEFGSSKSNVLKIKALKTLKKSKESSFDYKIDVKVSKAKVYLGEEIDLEVLVRLRSDIKLESVSPVNFDMFNILNSGNGQYKKNSIALFELFLAQDFESYSDFENGVKITIFKWVHKLYPNKVGNLKIPKFESVLAISSNNHYFFPTYSYKKAYSNEIEIEVDELPIKDKEVPVGTFSLFEMRIDNSKFASNDAANLTLILKGSSNFENININDLIALPEGIKVYKSKSNIFNDYSGKTFEFVLQFSKDGVFDIPEQKFKFFDPVQKKIKTLQTQALKVDVLPVKEPEKSTLARPVASAKAFSDGCELVEGAGRFQMKSQSSFDFYFPDWLFYFLLSFPFILILAFFVLRFLKSRLSVQYLILRIRFLYNKNLKFIFWAIHYFIALKDKKNIQDVDYTYLKNVFLNTDYDHMWIKYLNLLYSNIFAKEESEDKLYLIKNFVFFLKLIKK